MAELLYQSQKSEKVRECSLSIFTPTFNRKDFIPRTYKSIKNLNLPVINGKNICIEWIIVDDGSEDGTEELGKKWCVENILPIRYYKQKNQGKHVAMNFAVMHAKGKFYITIDSDDTILPDALHVFFDTWNSIINPSLFCGVSARCQDSAGHIVGSLVTHDPLDVSFTDLRMKYRIKGEMLEMYRTDILRQYPFPTYDHRMRFCPEAIVWHEMAKKYLLRVTNKAVRTYFYDSDDSLIKGKSISRSVSNYYLWRYIVNNLFKYAKYNSMEFLKACVGMSMDGFVSGKNIKTILSDCKRYWLKIIVLFFMPIGKLLSLIFR